MFIFVFSLKCRFEWYIIWLYLNDFNFWPLWAGGFTRVHLECMGNGRKWPKPIFMQTYINWVKFSDENLNFSIPWQKFWGDYLLPPLLMFWAPCSYLCMALAILLLIKLNYHVDFLYYQPIIQCLLQSSYMYDIGYRHPQVISILLFVFFRQLIVCIGVDKKYAGSSLLLCAFATETFEYIC